MNSMKIQVPVIQYRWCRCFPKVFYLMCGALGVFVVVLIIIKCCHENDQSSDSSNYNEIPTRTYRSQRRSRNYTDGYAPSTNVLYMNTNDHDHTDIISPLTIIRSNENHLDLPPTYIDSTENSRSPSVQNLDVIDAAICSEPPSYDQALFNMYTADDNICSGVGEVSNDTSGDCGTSGGNED